MSELRPAIIWDLDQTLVHFELANGTVDRWRDDLTRFFRPYGWEKPFRPLLSTLEEALLHLQLHKSPDEVQEIREGIYADLDQKESQEILNIHLIEPMIRRLSHWNRQGIRMALVTNNGDCGTRQALNAMNTFLLSENLTPPKWTVVLARGPRYLPKPFCDGMELAVSAIEQDSPKPFHQVWVIGDSVFDWEAAAKLRSRVPYSIQVIAAKDGHLNWIPEEQDSKTQDIASFLQDFDLRL